MIDSSNKKVLPSGMHARNNLSWKQFFIRALFFPVPGLEISTPLIGGKSFFEIAIAVGSLSLCILISIPDAGDAGAIANYFGAAIVTLGLRNNILFNFFGLTFERALFWHKFCAMAMICASIIHAIGELQKGAEDGLVSGFVLVALIGLMAFMYLVSFMNFNVFYFVHVLCFMALAPVAIIHGATIFGLFGILWGIDILVRYIFTAKKLSVRLKAVGSNITKISFDKTVKFNYRVGQYSFLMFSDINSYEYHPFSIVTSPDDKEVVFYVKNCGDWTNKLFSMAMGSGSNKEKDGAVVEVNEKIMRLEGPYGCLTLDIFRSSCHEVVMLIGGGIGITPLLSIWSHILHQQQQGCMKKVVVVWTVRTFEEAKAMYDDCLHELIERAPKELESMVASDAVSLESGVREVASVPYIAFEYHFHITACKENDATKWAEVSSLLPRPSIWAPGRVKINDVFSKTTQYCDLHGYKNVAVFVSGTTPLIHEVRQRCDASQIGVCLGGSNNGASSVHFDCHEEVFGF